jgi:hypothetical protein
VGRHLALNEILMIKQVNKQVKTKKNYPTFDFYDYYPIDEFCKITNTSTSTLNRYRRELKETNPNSNLIKLNRNGKLIFSYNLIKEFVGEEMFKILEEYKYTLSYNKALQNMIDGIKHKEKLGSTLFNMEWNLFITITYTETITKYEAYNNMTRLFNELITSNPQLKYRMYFTTENNRVKEGVHNHIVLHSDKDIKTLKSFIKNKYETAYIEDYDDSLPGIFYNEKDGLNGIDWDFLKYSPLA